MTNIAISTDTTCAISHEEANQLGIYVLPLNVIVDDKEYHDGVDINQEDLAKYMRDGSIIKTSTPTLYELETFFDQIIAKGYDKVIHFAISSKLSSIYEMFTVACKERYGDKVIIIDSRSVCSYMGNLVRHAVKLLREGKSTDAIVTSLQQRIGIENIYFIPESLTFLKRGGRISPSAAAIGNLLGIKPVLRFVNGAIEKHSTTRSVKLALPEIVKDFRDKNYDFNEYEIHVLEFDCEISSKIVYETMKKEFPLANVIITPLSINVCAHAGPGTVGIGVTKRP